MAKRKNKQAEQFGTTIAGIFLVTFLLIKDTYNAIKKLIEYLERKQK